MSAPVNIVSGINPAIADGLINEIDGVGIEEWMSRSLSSIITERPWVGGFSMLPPSAGLHNGTTSPTHTPEPWVGGFNQLPPQSIQDNIVSTPATPPSIGSILTGIGGMNDVKSMQEWFDANGVLSGVVYSDGQGRNTITSNLGNEYDITPSENHSTVGIRDHLLKGEPNSSVDVVDSMGQVVTRRWYDAAGNQSRDVDFTNHGNSKKHTEVPHEHGPRIVP